MKDFRTTELALRSRLKDTCHALGLDVTKAAQRLVLERIVDTDNWTVAFGAAPVMLTGGLLVAQRYRQTTDADVRAVRRYSESELVDGLMGLGKWLEDEGIRITSARVRKVDVGLKHPVDRLQFQATAGGVRANAHIDISYGWGPDAWPQGVEEFEFPGLSPKFKTYKALAQPLETAVAEKWLAALLQPAHNFRAKYLVDLGFFYKSYDLDDDRIASEIARIQRHRGIEWKDVVLRPKAVLNEAHFLARSEDWGDVCRSKGLDVDLQDTLVDLTLAYRRIQPTRRQTIFDHYRARDAQRQSLLEQDRYPEPLPPTPRWDNVVAFRR